jgi:hypothetical protein
MDESLILISNIITFSKLNFDLYRLIHTDEIINRFDCWLIITKY